MVFGGLVFVCIGISARTNTGKDSERLKNLSTQNKSAPFTWFPFELKHVPGQHNANCCRKTVQST